MEEQPRQQPRTRHRNRRVFIGVALLAAIFLAGPRVSIRDVRHDGPLAVPANPAELDRYLDDEEAVFANDLVPGTNKVILWHDHSPGVRTPGSVVLLHGFSGSRMTLSPFPEELAGKLHANLFCTRYAGHGRKNAAGYGEAMGQATLQQWVDDTREALAIGRVIGDKVVVIANSTAAPLAAWLASKGDAPDVLILLSPNFWPANRLSGAALLPWGRQFVWLVEGGSYEYRKENIYGKDHRKYATTAYPSRALVTMMAAVELGQTAALERVAVPALMLYREDDMVVSPVAAKRCFARFGGRTNRIEEVTGVTHRERHVLAGDLMSKGSTSEVVEKSLDFLHSIGIATAP